MKVLVVSDEVIRIVTEYLKHDKSLSVKHDSAVVTYGSNYDETTFSGITFDLED